MREEAIAGVQTILECEVIAFLSDSHIDADLAVETRLLAPRVRSSGRAENAEPLRGSCIRWGRASEKSRLGLCPVLAPDELSAEQT